LAQQRPGTFPASSTPDVGAIRALVDQYLSAYANKDLEGLIRLWSANSPDLESNKKATQRAFAADYKIDAQTVAISKIDVQGERASARVALEISAGKTDKPGLGKVNRALRFIKEDGKWKIWSNLSAEEDLARMLVAAGTDEARQTLLAE